MSTVTCEWGLAGAHALGPASAVLVVVDIVSFSTCVDVAVARGAEVYPFAVRDPAAIAAYALSHDALAAGPRGDLAFRFSLSPVSLAVIPAGTRLVLPSPNGSAISAAVRAVPVLAGCLRNARAVAAAALKIANGGLITIIAAGELWPDGSFRPAIEDFLGAGAIVAGFDVGLSDCVMTPEACVARDAYRSAGLRLGALVRDSISGRELIDRGYHGDVEAAIVENVSQVVPVLSAGRFIACQ
jgi:2-phosphosulfolactate phosphatase